MPVSISQVLLENQQQQSAVAAFNIPSFDVMLAAARASAETGRPVLTQISVGVLKTVGVGLVYDWFSLAKKHTQAEIYLHLDHCSDPELISSCIQAGWNMVMFDGSGLPFEENLRLTQGVVEEAHAAGVAVEGEVGGIGGQEDGSVSSDHLADPAEAIRFAGEAGVDCLAVGFGNAHGKAKSAGELRWDILEEVARATTVPLVLHGGTGFSTEEYRRAIDLGCSKVNVSTALKMVYTKVLARESLAAEVAKSPGTLHRVIEQECEQLCRNVIQTLA